MTFHNRYSGFSPTDFLENEWFVFSAIFILIFALVYIPLSRFFSKKKRFPWEETSVENKVPLAVVALIVAFFSASAITQRAFLYGYVGETIINWIYVILFVGFIFLIISIFASLRKRIGIAPAITSSLLLIWLMFRFFAEPLQYFIYTYGIFPYGLYDFFPSRSFILLFTFYSDSFFFYSTRNKS